MKSPLGWMTMATATMGVMTAIFAAEPIDGLLKMQALVHSRFPAVQQLSTAELATWLTDTHRMAPVLWDVRTSAEFAVSHLPGAVRVDPGSTGEQLASLLPVDRPVVVYCSVGYRSTRLATRLIATGKTNVANLEGSIFAWANENRPLVSDGRAVRVVHPYNRTFGRLLQKELWPANWETPH